MAVLRESGAFCLLVCPEGSGIAKEADKRRLDWKPVRFRNSIDILSIWRLRALLIKNRIDIGFCHSGHDANVFGIAARLVRRRPLILRVRTYQPGLARTRAFKGWADRTLVPSEYLRGRILANPDIDPSHIAVLRPLLPIEALRKEASLGLPNGVEEWLAEHSPVIAHAAMLRSEKGHRLALSALAQLREKYPRIGYVMAGVGPKEADLRKYVAKLGLENAVLFAGFLSPVAPLLARATVVIMPSKSEPLGLAQLEALVLGVPVAVSDVGGLPETVVHDHTGWVLPSENVDAWVEGLDEALSNPAEASSRAEAGRRSVEKQYAPGAFLAALEREIQTARETRGQSGK